MAKYKLEKLPIKNNYKANGRGRLACEHRRIAEVILGVLETSKVVHHLNLDCQDNRISNLIVMDNAEHIKLHAHLTREYNKALDKSPKQGRDFIINISKITKDYLNENGIEYTWLFKFQKKYNEYLRSIGQKAGRGKVDIPCRFTATTTK